MVSDDSADLIQRARGGDEAALAELIGRARPVLRRSLERRAGRGIRRTTPIEDLEQEVLLTTPELIGRLRPRATLEDLVALLQRHAAWAVGKAARRRARFEGESALLRDGERAPEPTDGSDSPDSMGPVTLDDERTWLLGRIASLDPGQAAVVRLRMEGATFGQIGARLGIGEDAARKRYAVAATELARSAARRREQD